MMPFDDAVPVPSSKTTSGMRPASQENKVSERSKNTSLPVKSTNRIGHDSAPSAAYGVAATVTVATTVVDESRGNSYNSSSCSSSAPLDPYKGSSVIIGPRSTSRNQRQQQQSGEASIKDSTFHSLEGVGNGSIGAGQRSLAMIDSDDDGNRFLSEDSGRGSIAGESEAASRFGVVGVVGAKGGPHEVRT